MESNIKRRGESEYVCGCGVKNFELSFGSRLNFVLYYDVELSW